MTKSIAIALGCVALLAAGWLGYLLVHGHDSGNPQPTAMHVLQQTKSDTGTSTPATPPPIEDEAAAVARVVEELQSDDPQTREKGKLHLATLPYDDHDRLRHVARALHDEARTLAEARLDEMDYHLAWEPLPVSLHVKDATMTEVISQLQPQMRGTTLATGQMISSRYTLDVEKKPFWEVLLALNDQAPLWMAPAYSTAIGGGGRNLGISYVAGRSLAMVQPVTKGPILFYVHWLGMPRSPAALERVATRPDQRYILSTMTVIDPRLLPLEFQQTFEPLVDELGHVLFTMPTSLPVTPIALLPMLSSDLTHQAQLQLTAPPDAGKRIVSVKANLRFVIGLNPIEGDLADVENHLGEPVELGATTASVSRFTTDTQLRIAATASSSTTKPYVVYDLYDRNDTLLVEWTAKGDSTRGALPNAGGPYRMHMTAPQKSREFTVEFEIRDVELPAL